MDVLIYLMVGIPSQCTCLQIITLYTLSTESFCELYLKAEKLEWPDIYDCQSHSFKRLSWECDKVLNSEYNFPQ